MSAEYPDYQSTNMWLILKFEHLTSPNSVYMTTSLTRSVMHYINIVNGLLIFHTVLPSAVT